MMLNKNLRSFPESKESLRWTSGLFIWCNLSWRVNIDFHMLYLVYSQVARHPDAVSVVTGIVGCAGLKVIFFYLYFGPILVANLFVLPYN